MLLDKENGFCHSYWWRQKNMVLQWKTINSDVSWGSVLGLPLFNFFINWDEVIKLFKAVMAKQFLNNTKKITLK